MKQLKKGLSLLLVMVMVVSLFVVNPLQASAATVLDALNSLSTQATYAPGSKAFGSEGCWRFVNAVSNQIFGINIPNRPSGYYLNGIADAPNWYCIKTLADSAATDSAVLNLLKQSKAGDIIQFKNTLTSVHTAMIYNTTASGITIYDYAHNLNGVRKITYSWNNLLTYNYGIGNFSGVYGYGLSLYRCNKNTVIQKPTVSVSIAGQTVTAKWSDVGSSRYWVYVQDLDTNTDFMGKDMGAALTRTVTLDPGRYRIWVSAYWGNVYASGYADFTVGEPQSPTVTADVTGSSVKISWNNVGAVSYYTYIHNIDTDEYFLGKSMGIAFTRTVELDPGNYRAIVTAVYTETTKPFGYTSFTVTPTTYTVTYDANGGSGAPASQTKTRGTPLILSAEIPSRTGYTFLGWAGTSNASVPLYEKGDAYTNEANATLYAVWKEQTYTITYDANGGEGSPANQNQAWGSSIVIPTMEPTRTDYTFLGWATTQDSRNANYQPGDSCSVARNTTFYAVWESNTDTVLQFIPDKDIVQPGDEIILTIRADKLPADGWSVLEFDIAYDETCLEPLMQGDKEYTEGSAIGEIAIFAINLEENPIQGAAVTVDSISNGDILHLKFKVKEDVLPNTEIVLTPTITTFDNSMANASAVPLVPLGSSTITLMVPPRELRAVTIVNTPDTTAYMQGDGELDLTGGQLMLIYDDNTTEVIELAADMVSGFDETVAGQQDVVVTFGDKTTTFKVLVVEAPPAPTPAYGNVDGSCDDEGYITITAADALLALQAATGKVDLTEHEQIVANVDGDEQAVVTANDALLILQYATKKIAQFPIEK